MGDLQWIKLNLAMFSNRKIRYIRHLPEGNNIVLIWIMLLVLAGKCNSGGMIFLTENVPYTTETLSDELGFETATVTLALRVLEELGMIQGGGALCITNWEEYQSVEKMVRIREQTRKRVADHRAKQKALETGNGARFVPMQEARNADVTRYSNVTCNAGVTQPNATEEEKEKEKERRLKNTNTNVGGIKEVVSFKGGTGEKHEAQTADSRRQTIRAVTDLFNQICGYASRVRMLSAPMEENVVSLTERYGIENIELAFQKAAASSVLNGNNKLQFKATFGWLMDDSHLAKTLNGDYDEAYSTAEDRKPDDLTKFCRGMAEWAEGGGDG